MGGSFAGFQDRCCYCFMGLRDGLCRCTCGLSLCSSHRQMHTERAGCSVLFDVGVAEDGTLAVENMSPAAEGLLPGGTTSPGALARYLESLASLGEDESDGRVECPHAAEGGAAEASLETPRCAVCGLGENLWMCLKCGSVGCGREQPGIAGRGHALAHFRDGPGGHAQAVYVRSLGGDFAPDVYCYLCDAFVHVPRPLGIRYDNPDAGRFQARQQPAEDDAPVVRSDARFMGILNAGQTCYVSSVLQMLGDLYQDYDLEVHFSLCEESPLECLGCQFSRIMTALRLQRRGARTPCGLEYLDIGDFLRLVFREMPQYVRGQQQDSAEFLQNLLCRIELYEHAMLLPPASDELRFVVETAVECRGCGHSGRNRSEDRILYVGHAASLARVVGAYFGETELPCSCGRPMSVRNTLVAPPRRLVVSVKRYRMEGGALAKISDPIDVDGILLETCAGTAWAASVQNCIVHTGSSLDCGHYTWWARLGGGCLLLNDRNVEASTEDALRDGAIFMLK